MAKWICFASILGLCIFANGQAKNLAYERGLPSSCEKCGSCPSESADCICFSALVFQEADLKSVFALLSDTSKINILVDPEISIKVTLKLENISWCQVFSLLLDLYNLRALNKNGYIYILQDNKYWSQKFGEIDNVNKEKQLRDTETRVIRINNVTASNMKEAVNTAMSGKGTIVTDMQSNSLIITDLPEQFVKIQAMIDSLDVVSRQIKITCQIIQIDQSSLKELGINWTADETNGNINASANMNQVGGAGGSALGNFQWGIISGNYNFNIRLSAIISAGKGKVLDQPNIITIENIQGEIFSGKQIPINITDVAGNIATQLFSIGTRMQVTPRIQKDNKVSLNIFVERSGYIAGTAGYEITTRFARTTLQVGSGDIAVLGGLVSNEQQNSEYGVPLLKDIPVIGELFKFHRKQVVSSVITIFITPEILQ
jgi:type II secretory pathway component GspD/PulD (secretin)